ncbi:hypothetical protein AVEN_24936-1 [Araneus ventricosus]|uniref:Uncharacterized protein n=1 Tax=Araneus ventricosus TaxID=182803 RepID=A0A4Y2PS67_ARAVE|nr:hypothetical protein AVEN_24936-1 [Araneus ventricosus]
MPKACQLSEKKTPELLQTVLPLSSLRIQGPLHNSRCSSSSTEAGVLASITGHCPKPPEECLYYHWRGRRNPTIIIPPGAARPHLRIRLLLFHDLLVSLQGRDSRINTRITPPHSKEHGDF